MPPTLESAHTPSPRPSGSLIGAVVAERWQVESVLGSGGMATVYKATHNRNGHRVALKVLHPELAVQKEVRERFYREAYIANRVAHPGVVTALDDGLLEDGTPFLVMELLEGQNLQDRWEQNDRRLPHEEVCELAIELLGILEVAHGKNIIHRDIKPENLFFTSDGELKLLDFGIAKTDANSGSLKTQNQTAMGTPSFMPPEQARGRWDEVDERADLFAVGATMFTLISGTFLHEGGTDNETLLSAMTRPARPLLSVAPETPQSLSTLIDRALSFAASDRFESAKSMREALIEVQTERADVVHSAPRCLELVFESSPCQAEVPRAEAPRPSLIPPRSTLGSTLPSASPVVASTPLSAKRRQRVWQALVLVASSLVGVGLVHAHGLGQFMNDSFARSPEMAALIQADPWTPPEEIWGNTTDASRSGIDSFASLHERWQKRQFREGQNGAPNSNAPHADEKSASLVSKLEAIERLVTATEQELPEVTSREIQRIGTELRSVSDPPSCTADVPATKSKAKARNGFDPNWAGPEPPGLRGEPKSAPPEKDSITAPADEPDLLSTPPLLE